MRNHTPAGRVEVALRRLAQRLRAEETKPTRVAVGAPAAPIPGDIWVDPATGHLKWVDAAGATHTSTN